MCREKYIWYEQQGLTPFVLITILHHDMEFTQNLGQSLLSLIVAYILVLTRDIKLFGISDLSCPFPQVSSAFGNRHRQHYSKKSFCVIFLHIFLTRI